MEPFIRNMPENFGGLEWKDVTTIHPISLCAILILAGTMLFIPRRWSVMPMLLIACFIPLVQKIVIFGLDFNLLRIMVLFGVVRVIVHKEYKSFIWTTLDKVVLFWIISLITIDILRTGMFSTCIFRLGFGFDSLGAYFVLRCIIKSWEDVSNIVLGLILISVPVVLFFLIENRTGRNMFSIFGGVPAFTIIRDDRLRCQGPYSHPIDAGCIWASFIPLMAAYWWRPGYGKLLALTGVMAGTVIVICTASSTPIMGCISGLIGALMFTLRYQMRYVRWTLLVLVLALHIIMKAPVWFLIGRISAVGGSTGFFRAQLIDGAITNFSEWAVLGTNSISHWFWGAQDVCNYFVYQAVTGGILALSAFIIVIVISFRNIGRLWRSQPRYSYNQILAWTVGISLFVHCTNFIGLSYIGAIFWVWILTLAIIGSLSFSLHRGNQHVI